MFVIADSVLSEGRYLYVIHIPPKDGNQRPQTNQDRRSEKLKTAEVRADRPSINTLLSNEQTTQCVSHLVFHGHVAELASPVISFRRRIFLYPLVREIEDLAIILKEPIIIHVTSSTSPTPSRDHNLLFIADVHMAGHGTFHG